uniref:caspase recruitment domain-containing protein 14 n=1 Tax=Doryrhamphus excisus TaxID=161450 RepID=UPI0025AE347F|nr:caspase recruitment domain-containing protein 14 [Doryrhamphus excisus]XP_057924360.1 caspase recruitment domain-containing protein 14 [Doryrhamphus excisus]XP_057924369.1 caspase recruitment domain-containing protein 14 [Doryrhamphus excisus]XP_057924378.1 caspase recruitment domain-containing protein 14 [Doryrhamphus excisus]XP_057924387.1 caspase recruitment domain-containing protein 14 [Doryrhamphus excisus]XP_057924395.1 caspase recruitment domain-containing protein 14 [Doryrhamphus ex
MAGESTPEGLDLKEKGEEELWELINDNRHRISLGVRPCIVIPYLRQARVLTEMDEDEILSCHNLTNRSMRTSHMMDLLRTQGRNGAVALLESLMIHYPTLYTQVTGHKPSTEPSRFSGLIKYSELTEYLIRAVTGMQNELQEARCEAGRMNARCASLESEIQQVMEHEEKSRSLQSEYKRVQRHLCSLQREVTNLKEEKCDLYARYTTAIEEKSAMSMRLHDLNLQIYQLQTELQKAQTESDFQKRRSLRCVPIAEASQLQEEVRSLRCQLLKMEKLNPAHQDILAQDLAEAIDSQVELAEQLKCSREENEQLHREKQKLLDQSECLTLQVQQLTLDCNMHQQRSTVIQNQMRELQTERDQAYLSRNEAQTQIASILSEKDTLRSQMMALKEAFSLHDKHPQDWQRPDETELDWECSRSNFKDSSLPNRRRLCRMDAINPSSPSPFSSECEEAMASSVRSRNVEPPSPQSLRRREGALYDDNSLETLETDDFSLDDDFVILPSVLNDDKETSSQFTPGRTNNTYSLDKNFAPPFLVRSRPKAIRISGRVVTISFQGDALLSQVAVLGGNKTGVFVHEVTEGSAAHTVGISRGAQIVEVRYQQNQKVLRVVLEDSTLEEAMWALGQVTDLCHLSLRPRQHDYELLLQQLQNNEMSSGDSFYVRVNVTIPAGPNGTLAVACDDILHVTNTRPSDTDGSWYASQVHPCQLLALHSGLVANYYRAQQRLIRAIEEMNFQIRKSHKDGRLVGQNRQKEVRIVSLGLQGRNPLWVSVENDKTKSADSGDASAPRSCVTLMPYTLVTPHFPPICRPVLLLPSMLGRILDKKVAGWQGFELCEPEMLSASDHSVRLQKSELLEECEQGRNCCYTLQCVKKVMQKGIHCVLPLGLDCVRRLHRAEIFPIIIFISQSVSSARKLRSKLHRQSWSEEQLLMCSRSQEPLLDKLPCLYHRVAPDSWCDQASLLTRIRTVIWEEQKKIVWVEPDLW